MRHSKNLQMVAVAALTACSLLIPKLNPSAVGNDSIAESDDVQSLDINGVMRLAMTKGLCRDVIKGKASEADQQKLVELFQHLETQKPRKGELEQWKKLTAAMTAAAKDVAAGKPAHKALRKSANCVLCHKSHRPK